MLGAAEGQASDIAITAKQILKLKETLNKIISSHTGQPLPKVEKDTDRDFYMTAEEAKKYGIVDTPTTLWNYFLDVAKKNLHLILAMSPSGETLRVRCRNFPGLVSCTTIDWFFKWPDEALKTVSAFFLKDEAANFPDPADRATQEEEFSLELRTRDRERKLIKKIDKTLVRVEEDDYGFCDQCGVEVGIRRLEARPTADLCVDCKTLDEIKEKQITGG